MRLRDLGEIEFIKRISKRIKTDSSVIKGIGDDAAVIKWRADKYLLFASDMMVEGVHFNLKDGPYRIGRKALAVNISDIAAMGGEPRYAVLSLGLPDRLNVKFMDRLYSGLLYMAKRYGVNMVGGDTNSSENLTIDVSIIGEVKKGELLLRSGAKPGDIIVVTGALGGSIRGKHLTFTPRLAEARFLAKNFKISSMIDISDGLSLDLARMCGASGGGARIYESLIPVSEGSSLKGALHNGEDFELLFTVPKDIVKDLIRKFKRRFKTPISAIGEITKRREGLRIIDRYGRAADLKAEGFRHF